jgi:excisionase family DNA binding protein
MTNGSNGSDKGVSPSSVGQSHFPLDLYYKTIRRLSREIGTNRNKPEFRFAVAFRQLLAPLGLATPPLTRMASDLWWVQGAPVPSHVALVSDAPPTTENSSMTVTTPPPADSSAALLDVRAVARLLACSVRHVYRLADSSRMPPPVRLGALVRWPRSAIENWIAAGCPDARTWEAMQTSASRRLSAG